MTRRRVPRPFAARLLTVALAAVAGCSGVRVPPDLAESAHPTAGLAPDSTVEALDLAVRLVEYGRARRQAEPLLAAARILLDVPYTPVVRAYDGAADGAADGSPGGFNPLNPADVLAEARAYTAADPAARALADTLRGRVARRNTRGPTDAAPAPPTGGAGLDAAAGGRDVSVAALRGGDTHRVELSLRRGSIARIVVRGDGRTNLDCAIGDTRGAPLDEDTRPTDACDLGWRVERDGTYRLTIENLGPYPNTYLLFTN